MKLTIHKHVFRLEDELQIESHRVVSWLDVQMQHGTPAIWVLVDADTDLQPYILHVRGTGHPFRGDEGEHIGTFQLASGNLVFHLFSHVETA